ncbi:MAG TPA: histidine phosphatase family protein [Patescibacteria group bacterium]|nr:histidine phosphatase family protein [Patescibacteria group bacterium]
MQNVCTFYIVRHGQSTWNVRWLMQGQQVHPPLTTEGKKQAKALSRLLEDVHFDAIYSSDLLRAKQTAEIIALERKLEVITTELIRERKLGKLEGQSLNLLKEFDKNRAALSYEERRKHKEVPEMESDEEITTRFVTFLRETAIRNVGKTILLVSHSGIMRPLLIHLGWATYENFTSEKAIHNASYIKLESDGIDFFVKETYGIDKPE